MNGNVIEARGVCKAFGDKPIFEGLSLDIARGETLTILGASGSGKSVFLKMILGLVEVDAGAILIDGQDVVALDEEARAPLRRRVSMLFQGGALFDSLSVADNIAFPLRRQRRDGHRLDAQELTARTAQALELVGLPGTEAMMPSELSGGMKKRVALARAIAVEPEVVLYDEPTTGLDPINTRRINDLIRAVQARLHITSVVVTHDLASAYWVSDRIAMLDEHRIVAVEPTAAFQRSAQASIRAFVSAMALPAVTP